MSQFPGVYLEELPGAFHSISPISPSITGLAGMVNSENLPFARMLTPGRTNSNWQSDWKYVNIRREVLFIEQSLSNGLQWVVFENNTPSLWSEVAQSLEGFLTRQWLSGALHGKKKDEAFFVKCDTTTMTQNDIDNGRLVVVVGFAPLQPAEFVVVQIAILLQDK